MTKKNSRFPSDLIDPSLKNRKWRREFVKAAHKQYYKSAPRHGINARNKQHKYAEWRGYANGEQSINIYEKKLMRKDKSGQLKTFKNIDWSILKVAPRFKRVVAGMLMDTPQEISVQSIDPVSVNNRKEYKMRLQEFMANRDFINETSQTSGTPVDSPIEQGVPIPKNDQELEIHMNLFFKDEFALEFRDALEAVMSYNNWEQVKWDISENIVEVGTGGTKAYLDSNGFPKLRSVVPENLMHAHCERNDFKDARYIGEYIYMTIADLKQLAGDQFTEAEYKKIAEEVADRNFHEGPVYGKGFTYEYDEQQIMVLDIQWYSVDKWVHEIGKNKAGNIKVSQRDVAWFDPNKKYRADRKKEIVRNDIKNVYTAMWIVGTDFLFNDGLQTDMVRAASNLADTQLGYHLYRTGRGSLISELIPIFDNIQINWLQYQNQIARSTPSGAFIEMSAFENISMGGSGGAKMDPKDVLSMYFDTGVLVYRAVDAAGRPNSFQPITETTGGIPDAAAQHLQFIIQNINFLRDITGLNEATDASTPGDDLTKAQGAIATQGTSRALRYVFHGFKMVFESTIRTSADLFMDSVKKGPVESIVGMLGHRSWKFLNENTDVSRYEVGITIEDQPDDKRRARLDEMMLAAVAAKELLPEDVLIIEKEKNVDKQVQMMIIRRKQREEELAKLEADKIRANGDVQVQSTEAATQAKLQEMEAEKQMKLEIDSNMMALTIQKEREAAQAAIVLAKLNNGAKLTETERKIAGEIMKVKEKGSFDLAAARIKASQKKSSSDSK
jgi:uncharacterized protein (UPF0305 family)